MSHASNFGTVNIERPKPSTVGPFWTTARRETAKPSKPAKKQKGAR